MKVKDVELGDKCALCGSEDNLEIHHIVPISKGGTNEIENLAVLCRKCNRRIQNKIIPIIEEQLKINQWGGNGKRTNNSNSSRVIITIRDDQAEWLENNFITLSRFVQAKIDEEIEKRKGERKGKGKGEDGGD